MLRRRARYRSLWAFGSALLLVSGCSSAQEADVERVATAFADPAGDAGERCDLLAPAALAALEEIAPCTEAIERLPLDGGAVQGVEVWGGEAQVTLLGDTVFLTETSAGWKVTAAACRRQADAPYDCEVEP